MGYLLNLQLYFVIDVDRVIAASFANVDQLYLTLLLILHTARNYSGYYK